MKKPLRAALLALGLAGGLAAWFLAPSSAPRRPSHALGVIGNFKGKNAQVGVEAFNAIKLAYDEYKTSHPDGFDLSILPVDDSWEPSKTLPAYLRCADKVDLLIVLTGSTSFMLIYDEVLKRPSTLHAILGPTTTLLSGKDDNVVRNICDMEKEQQAIAEFAATRNIERLLIVTETEFNAQYTEPAARYFQQYARIPHVDVASFSGNLMDTDAAKEMLRAHRYDAMYALVGGMPRETAILIQQARSIQKDIPVFITPWARGLIFEQALGQEINGIYMPCQLKLFDNPRIDRYMAAYHKKFGAESREYFGPLMYDLAGSVFESLHLAESPATASLLPVMLAGQFEGTMGVVRYDAFGDADSQMYFYEMTNGTWRSMPSEAGAPPSSRKPPRGLNNGGLEHFQQTCSGRQAKQPGSAGRPRPTRGP